MIFVRRAGVAVAAAAKPAPKAATMSLDFMLKDPFYEPDNDTVEPSIADELFGLCKPPRRPSPAKKRPQATASIFLPGGAQKAWDAANKWPGKGRITSPSAMKAAAAQSLKAGTEGPTTNAVCVDKRTGLAFYRHADGRLSPREM